MICTADLKAIKALTAIIVPAYPGDSQISSLNTLVDSHLEANAEITSLRRSLQLVIDTLALIDGGDFDKAAEQALAITR